MRYFFFEYLLIFFIMHLFNYEIIKVLKISKARFVKLFSIIIAYNYKPFIVAMEGVTHARLCLQV